MAIELTPLPYDRGALEPHLSAEAVELHHGRYQRAHVECVNAAIAGTGFANATLEEIVGKAQGMLFDHAAQVWNDTFYWDGLRPAAGGGGGEPRDALADAIARRFGDFARFKTQFTEIAMRMFGAGWTWLVQRPDGALAIVATANAATPFTGTDTPLLACCLWEHAYATDYRDAREKYVEAFWHLVNWDAVAARMR